MVFGPVSPRLVPGGEDTMCCIAIFTASLVGFLLRRHARCSLSVLRDGPHLCSGLVWKERHVMSICLPAARQLSDEVLQALRLRALRGCELGFTEIGVAELLGLSRETVSRWWTAYAEDGVEALPGERTGRPVGSGRTLIDGQEAWLRTILNQKSPEEVGIASPLWTRRAVADLIRKQFGIDMPVRTVGEYLRRWGYTVKVPRRHAKDQDPEEVRKWLEETYPAIERRAAGEDRRTRPTHPDEHDLDDQQRGIGPLHDLQGDHDGRPVHHVPGATARRDDPEGLPDRGSAEGP